MDENIIDSGLSEFESGFYGDDYQTATNETEEEKEDTTDTSEEETEETSEEPVEGAEEEKTESEETSEEEVNEEEAATQEEQSEEETADSFTIKVNKEERKVSREEMTALAQKGADYDRVKGQVKALQEEVETLKAQKGEKSKYDPVIAQLEAISRTTDTPLEDLTLSLRKSIKKHEGLSEAEIEATIRAEDAEWKIQSMQNPQTDPDEDKALARYNREMEEFAAVYPDIGEPSEEDWKLMSDDVKAGMSAVNAYAKMQNEKNKAAHEEALSKIAKLEKQLAQEKRNRKNFYASPGSMSDQGGKMNDDGLEAFISGLR